MEIQQIQQMLALVSLLMGGLLIGIIYNAYRIVKQQTLLYFIYGLFTLIVGIAFADIVSILTPDAFVILWSTVFSRLVVIIGLGVMTYGVLRG
ncbi:hypothetical protein ABH15_11650 [Methanoculleus taiwanensis]|uniref:NiFe hydrogenase n=1 Tax=Methanoculleus taiwanensis TaxID=1550565 RepID=A0A498GZ74_9EURY|nr:hypothetical protein [Methanoculleus taiwanensis]RXE55395.1 hypothetical protein ABH15_11650 [Methanoculleus taiwanensis]